MIQLTNTVTPDMVEQKFFVTRQSDTETIFDIVMRTGLAADFPGAVALLANTFPPPAPPRKPLWKALWDRIPGFRERPY
ncbi:MAG: hypothetical protein K0S28_1721 [Paucimonas sp.]|nr:hypothetical protein [Paucimonas sp.]